MASAATICYCGKQKTDKTAADANSSLSPLFANNAPQQQHLLCQHCATRHLASQIARYCSANDRHEQKKEGCHRRLLETRLRPAIDTDNSDEQYEPLSSRQPLPDPNQINQRVSQLKQRLDMLRSQTNDAAVRLTAKTVENDEREESLHMNSEKVQLARERLERMRQCLLMTSDDDSTNLGGGLKDALVSGTQQIQTLRFRFACKVFDMHRLDVGEQYAKQGAAVPNTDKSTKGNESATGVGKIGGLPLPHAGPVLYGVIPSAVLASSLRLVASLTQLVARCLGVVLPHPILVCFKECCRCGSMYDFGGDVIDVSNYHYHYHDDEEQEGEYVQDMQQSLCSACCNEGSTNVYEQPKSLSASVSSSQSQRKSSLLSLVGSSARKAISLTTSATSRAITHMQQSSHSVDLTPSGQFSPKTAVSNAQAKKPSSNKGSTSSRESISRRIKHASFAYLRENYDKSATEYVLNPPRWDEANKDSGNMDYNDPNKKQTADQNHMSQAQTFSTREEFHVAEERFATGLQLLQNDVVALCFRAGVDVSALWPAESVLLNLHSLWSHCQKMAEAK